MIADIQSPINPADLQLIGIDQFIGEVGQFMPEVQKHLTTVQTAITEVKQSQDMILENVLHQLNLIGQLDAVNDFWKDL